VPRQNCPIDPPPSPAANREHTNRAAARARGRTARERLLARRERLPWRLQPQHVRSPRTSAAVTSRIARTPAPGARRSPGCGPRGTASGQRLVEPRRGAAAIGRGSSAPTRPRRAPRARRATSRTETRRAPGAVRGARSPGDPREEGHGKTMRQRPRRPQRREGPHPVNVDARARDRPAMRGRRCDPGRGRRPCRDSRVRIPTLRTSPSAAACTTRSSASVTRMLGAAGSRTAPSPAAQHPTDEARSSRSRARERCGGRHQPATAGSRGSRTPAAPRDLHRRGDDQAKLA